MSTPKGLTVGPVRVEYVRTRRVLRLSVDGERRPHEIALDDLSRELDLASSDLVPATRYWLFAGGPGSPQGGSRDLIGSYESQHDARQAFVRTRQESASSWAELVEVRASGNVRPICWFGDPGDPGDPGDRGDASGGASPRARRRLGFRALVSSLARRDDPFRVAATDADLIRSR